MQNSIWLSRKETEWPAFAIFMSGEAGGIAFKRRWNRVATPWNKDEGDRRQGWMKHLAAVRGFVFFLSILFRVASLFPKGPHANPPTLFQGPQMKFGAVRSLLAEPPIRETRKATHPKYWFDSAKTA